MRTCRAADVLNQKPHYGGWKMYVITLVTKASFREFTVF